MTTLPASSFVLCLLATYAVDQSCDTMSESPCAFAPCFRHIRRRAGSGLLRSDRSALIDIDLTLASVTSDSGDDPCGGFFHRSDRRLYYLLPRAREKSTNPPAVRSMPGNRRAAAVAMPCASRVPGGNAPGARQREVSAPGVTRRWPST